MRFVGVTIIGGCGTFLSYQARVALHVDCIFPCSAVSRHERGGAPCFSRQCYNQHRCFQSWSSIPGQSNKMSAHAPDTSCHDLVHHGHTVLVTIHCTLTDRVPFDGQIVLPHAYGEVEPCTVLSTAGVHRHQPSRHTSHFWGAKLPSPKQDVCIFGSGLAQPASSPGSSYLSSEPWWSHHDNSIHSAQ